MSLHFVTGGSGLIGSALVARLRASGHEVLAPARDSGSGRGLDLKNPQEILLPSDITTAYLCAWSGGVVEAAKDSQGTRKINVEGNRVLIERLKQAGARVVFLSTSLVHSGEKTTYNLPTTPCCEYAKQKVAVEEHLDPATDMIVRLSKVGETLLPRLRQWVEALQSGKSIVASECLRVAPVMLEEVAAALEEIAGNFVPGIYQMSGRADFTYRHVADVLAGRMKIGRDRVLGDTSGGAELFHPLPATGRLEIHAPDRAKRWPSGDDRIQLLVERVFS